MASTISDMPSESASATAQLADISWSDVVLYPKGPKASDIQYAPTLRLPAGWQFGTALVPASRAGGAIHFEPVSLETLVDSPVVAGAHFRTVDLSPGGQPPHFLVGAEYLRFHAGDHAARNRLIQAHLRLVPLPRDLRATCRAAPVAGGIASQPTRTHSIEIEPPSIPSTGRATASSGRCIPST